MKAIFADIDGPLSPLSWKRKVARRLGLPAEDLAPVDLLCPERLRRLRSLLVMTGTELVIASNWRIYYPLDELRSFFEAASRLTIPILDVTPVYSVLGQPRRRGEEIAAWLAEHREVRQYAILDDQVHDLGCLDPGRVVQTTERDGFLQDHAQALEKILGLKDGGQLCLKAQTISGDDHLGKASRIPSGRHAK